MHLDNIAKSVQGRLTLWSSRHKQLLRALCPEPACYICNIQGLTKLWLFLQRTAMTKSNDMFFLTTFPHNSQTSYWVQATFLQSRTHYIYESRNCARSTSSRDFLFVTANNSNFVATGILISLEEPAGVIFANLRLPSKKMRNSITAAVAASTAGERIAQCRVAKTNSWIWSKHGRIVNANGHPFGAAAN